MPGVARKSVVLAANASDPNILSGTQVEYNSSPVPVRCIVAASSSVGTTKIGLKFGSRSIMDAADALAPLEPAAGQGPTIPDDIIVDALVYPGERIYLSAQDGGAGSTTRFLVQLT